MTIGYICSNTKDTTILPSYLNSAPLKTFETQLLCHSNHFKKIINFCTRKLFTTHQQPPKKQQKKHQIRILNQMFRLFINTNGYTLLMKNNHIMSVFCGNGCFSCTHTTKTSINMIHYAVVTWSNKYKMLQKNASKSQCNIVSAMFCTDNKHSSSSPTHCSLIHIKPSYFVPLLRKKIDLSNPQNKNSEHHKNGCFSAKNGINQLKYQWNLALWFSPTVLINYFTT